MPGGYYVIDYINILFQFYWRIIYIIPRRKRAGPGVGRDADDIFVISRISTCVLIWCANKTRPSELLL